MAQLEGRVAIITGAGRGIGREHALLFAREGAKVVVNDLGAAPDGIGEDKSPAEQVVAEIIDSGGQAIASHDDVASWEGAQNLIDTTVDHFGDLNVLVNNAGILRDRMIINMSEEEWDSVVRVHLRGHFCPLRWAATYWRQRSKAGDEVKASVINTSSTSGLFGNPGQVNYGVAKMGIAAMTIIAAKELERYGVRVNAIAPAARTRLTANLGGSESAAPTGFDVMDPANISPFVAYLATAECPVNGRAFLVWGGDVQLFQPWAIVDTIHKDGRWDIAELQDQAAHFADFPFDLKNPFGY